MALPVQDHIHTAVQVEHALGCLQGHVQPPLPAQLCCRRLQKKHADNHCTRKLLPGQPARCSLQRASPVLVTRQTVATAKPNVITL